MELLGSNMLRFGVVVLCISQMAFATMLRRSGRMQSNEVMVAMTPTDIDSRPSQPPAFVATTKVPTVVVEISFDGYPQLQGFKDFVVNYGLLIVFSAIIWIAFMAIAFAYRNSEGYLPEVAPNEDEHMKLQKLLSQWQVEWYQCCTDPSICFWSCCCPCIRWGHTMDLLRFLDYGPAVVVFFMLQWMNCLTGFVVIGIYMTMVLTYYRQKLRKAFGMPKYGTFCGYLEDCFCLCFCTPCIFAQEALHVQRAAEMGFALPAVVARNKEKDVMVLDATKDVMVLDATNNSALAQLPREPLKGLASPGMSSSVPSFHDVNSKSSGSNESLTVQDGILRDNGSRSSSAESGREASTVIAKPREVTGSRRQYGRSSRLIQNPTPERLLASPPVRLGAHGDVKGKISLVQLMGVLHDDLRAYVFLFVEVGCVGHCAASCHLLHFHIWADRAFWHFYVGSGVNDRLAQPSSCPAAHLREAFRRWIFHIDGAWTRDLRDFVGRSRTDTDQVVMLSYARYIASGLMPYDSRISVAEFAGIVGELIADYNPREVDARQEAEALTAQIECMGEVFSQVQIKGIVSAFDCSLGRVSSTEEEEEFGEHEVFPNADLQVVDEVQD